MAKEKEFKKQLLYVGYQSDGIIKQMNEAKNNLNKTIQTVENIIKISFTDAEKIQLKNNGFQFLKNKITEISPFKNASEDFNLESLGMNLLKSVLKSYEQTSKIWLGYNFELKEGMFEIPKKEIDRIIEENSVYTETEQQNKVIEITDRIANLHNEIIKMGIPQLKGNAMDKAGTSILLSFKRDGSGCLETNRAYVERLSPNYKTWKELFEEKRRNRAN